MAPDCRPAMIAATAVDHNSTSAIAPDVTPPFANCLRRQTRIPLRTAGARVAHFFVHRSTEASRTPDTMGSQVSGLLLLRGAACIVLGWRPQRLRRFARRVLTGRRGNLWRATLLYLSAQRLLSFQRQCNLRMD